MKLRRLLHQVQGALVRLAPAMRAAGAVVACIAAGQLVGQTALGLVVAVGARRVVTADPGGRPIARGANMAIATAAAALAAFAGTLLGHSLAFSAVGMFALGWVTGVARSRSEAAGRLAVAPAILFALAQILPGDVPEAAVRALAVALGGALGLSAYLFHYPRGWWRLALRRVRAGLHFLWRAGVGSETDVRFGLLLAATVSLCLLVVRLLHLPRGNWVVVSVLVVLRPEARATRRRGLERVYGTAVGCLLAAVLVFLVRSAALADVLLFVLMAGYFRLQPTAYGWSLAFFTPALVLGIGLLEPGNWHWAANRAVDVAAGTVVALLVGLLLGARLEPPARSVV